MDYFLELISSYQGYIFLGNTINLLEKLKLVHIFELSGIQYASMQILKCLIDLETQMALLPVLWKYGLSGLH